MAKSAQYVYLHEFFLLLVYLSVPVLIATGALLWLGIRRLRLARGLSPLRLFYFFGILVGVSVGAIVLAIPFWRFWPETTDPMLAGFLCGPTLAASLLLTPLTLFVLHRRWVLRSEAAHEDSPPPSHSAS